VWRDQEKNVAEIAKFSKTDAENFPAFIRLVSKLSEVLNSIMLLTPPSVTQNSFDRLSFDELLAWGGAGLKLKRSGKREMMEFLRILPMTVVEFLNEWFENEALKAVLGAAGVTGSMQGPQASGTAFMMLYHYLGAFNGGFRSSRFVKGGIGQLSAALAKAAREHGAEIRHGAEVMQIKLNGGKATGVLLKNGEEISGRAVISNADPRRTFFDLVGAPKLGPTFVRRIRNIRFRGATAKVNLALHDLPHFKHKEPHLSGHIIICPSLEYLEHAYDDAKYGRYSQQPCLDVIIPTVLDSSLAPAGKHIMSINMQYAPYKLREGNWNDDREKLGDHIMNTLAEYAPSIKELILHRQIITPLDWERDYALTEGGEFHGQMGLDQLLFMRPVAGYGQYRTPIENLYLCGAGTHPGGGVTGAPGYNAAREVLKDWKR
jgi:phytoene dehydrogenase-like protein